MSTSIQSFSKRAALALVPITPAALSGSDALYGWGRLIIYTSLAVATWNKTKQVRYVFAGAAALSLVTSLTAHAWNKQPEISADSIPQTGALASGL